MSTFLIILATILWVGYSSYRKIKNAASDAGGEAMSQPSRPASAFEAMCEEEEKPMAAAQEYFTYETLEDEVNVDLNLNVDANAEVSAYDSDIAGVRGFDLRQAVIYQTILDNKYLHEVHPC